MYHSFLNECDWFEASTLEESQSLYMKTQVTYIHVCSTDVEIRKEQRKGKAHIYNCGIYNNRQII